MYPMKRPLLLPVLLFLMSSLALAASNVSLDGSVGYSQDGVDITLRADRVVNNDPVGTTSGTLQLALWGSESKYFGGLLSGWKVALSL